MVENVIKAAGVVMTREGVEGTEIALIHRSRRDDWSLPKGKVDPGELLPITAAREAWEETGFTVRLGAPLPMQRYLVMGQPKEVHYWKARSIDGEFVANDEVDVLRWVPLDIGRAALSYPRDAEIVDAAVAAPTTTPLIILRHATAMKRAPWKASGNKHSDEDRRRPLAEEGLAQLPLIASLLEAYGITAIHSSDATRCHDTVRLYAEKQGLLIEPEPDVSEEGHRDSPDAAADRIEHLMHTNAPIVVCSHRPVLGTLLRAIVGVADDIDPTEDNLDPALPPGGMIVIHRDAQRLSRVVAVERYLTA